MRFWRLGAVLVLGLAVLTSPSRPGSGSGSGGNGGVRVMPLGDSITDGFTTPGGYRIELWQRLSGRYAVDFVGSASNGPGALGDHDHEGHSGWRIDQLDAKIVTWIRAANPRTVLLHAGTNDLVRDHDVAGAPARLGALVDRIRALAPLAEVFVAQITPIPGDAVLEERVRAFNAEVPAIVARRGPRTHLVDQHSGFTAADLEDGLHPNATGYAKMADRWAAALESVPAGLTAVGAPPVDATTVLPNLKSLRCLAAEGDRVLVRDCDGGAGQAWVRGGAGELRAADGRCLTDDRARLAVRSCDGAPGQLFSFSPTGSITATGSGGCLEPDGVASGALVRLVRCDGTAGQRWPAR
jgi:lysophospholipase L1-like esterase